MSLHIGIYKPIKPVEKLNMYITAMLSWDGHWGSSIVVWIPD